MLLIDEQTIREQLSRFMDAEYNDLLACASQNLPPLMEELQACGLKSEDVLVVLLEFLRATVAADRDFSDTERQFARDIFTENYKSLADTFAVLRRSEEKERRAFLTETFAQLSEKGKVYALNVLSAFVAVDGRMDRAEVRFIGELING